MKYYLEYDEEMLTNLIERTDQYKANLLEVKDNPRMVLFFKHVIDENEKFLENIILEKE